MSVLLYESDIESALVKRADTAGGICLKHGQDGWPDRLIILPGGVLVWCELKRGGGKLAPLQRLRIKRLRDLGQRVEVVWSREQADALMDELTSG